MRPRPTILLPTGHVHSTVGIRRVEAIGRNIKETVAREASLGFKVTVGGAHQIPGHAPASGSRMGCLSSGHLALRIRSPQLSLSSLIGIGRSMEARLHGSRIHAVSALCDAPRKPLHSLRDAVLGDRLWNLLRGVELPDLVTARKSIRQAHVL